MVPYSCYLVRTLTAMDDDWTAVVVNHLKVKRAWERLSRI